MKTLNVLLEITIYSSVLFFAIMMLKLCFKNKMSPFLHFAIWGLLIARLLMPITMESSVHLAVIPNETQNPTAQQLVQPSASNDTALNTEPSATFQTKPRASGKQQTQTATAPFETSKAKQPLVLSTQGIILAIWLTGAGMGLLYLSIIYGVLRKRIRRYAEPPSERLLRLFEEVKAELIIKRNVKIIGQCEYGTPAMLFPNTVLMPINMLVSMSDEEVKFVLRHELMHFKRGDHILGLALSVLNAVYWFNPIVWIAFKQIRVDMETACDSGVVRYFSSEEKSTYAAVILSLFSKKQYGNLALGMAQGNTKKIAEKRIRGVFMNNKSNRTVKMISTLLASLLFFTCFTTACQPTPETPPVIQRVEDIPKEAIIETAPPSAEIKNTVEPAVYSAAEHWTETVKKNDFISIEVDSDILMPGATTYPVERLERVTLTQERVNELIAYFTEPGTKFYTGENVMLKSDYEEELIFLKQELQKVLDGGDGETPESIRSYIKETERKLAEAPESYTYTYVEPVFTYDTDYETGEPNKEHGENSISVSLELPDGDRYGSIYASRYEKGKNTGTHFSYCSFSGGWNTESYFTWYDEELKREMERYEEINDDEWKNDLNRQREFVDAGLKSMQGNTMDLRAAADSAIKLLEELEIEDMQLKSYEKAMYSMESGQEDCTIPACYVEFVRECGGIPSLSQRGGSFSNNLDYSELYCAPFGLESVSMLISEEGVVYFSWGDMAQVVERVAEDTELMPLDEIKQHVLDYIYFMNGAWLDGQYGQKRINIEEMRLVTTYINAKDDPERVLIVPAWQIMTQEEHLFDQTDTWQEGNEEEYMINALDGSGILMPGILERMQERGNRS